MAVSTCDKCGGHLFEIVEKEPSLSKFKYFFVQCSSCGNVVGVLNYYNLGYLLKQQNKAIKKIANQLGISVDLD